MSAERQMPPRNATPLRPVYTTAKRNGSRLTEWGLFAVVGVMVLVGALALYNEYAPKMKVVPNTVEAGFKANRINVLLIGVGGPTHPGEGKDLADAIMVLSLKPSTRQAALISIPRDLWVKIGHDGVHRINAAHAIGEENGYPGGGPQLLRETVEQVLGQPIHAYIRLDFSAFEKVIDQVGGIDIYVYRPFYDFLFKDQFNRGWQHMNGKRALRYARSRYILSAEGNNFARELRQQQVIAAIRDKVRNLSTQQALSLVGIAHTVSSYSDTNLTTQQMVELYSMYRGLTDDKLRHVSLAPFLEVFMVTNPSDPGEAVRPPTGAYQQIHIMARNVFNGERPIVTRDEIQLQPPPPKPAVVPPSIGLENGAPTRY